MTISDSSCQVRDSSSLEPMVVSLRCEATLELGRKLTKELGLEPSVDTLGRWMVHYIAELIQDAEKASTEERSAKMQTCCDAILKLWAHRHTLSNGKRPFEELEPLIRTLASIDPEYERSRYFDWIRARDDDTEESDETKSWLKLIDDLDYSARILIRYCLTQAAQTGLDKSMEWVALAEAADVDEIAESPLVRLIFEEDSLLKVSNPDEKLRQKIEDRIERLEEFAKMAVEVAAELRRALLPNQIAIVEN